MEGAREGLVRAFKHPARDDLGLNFASALEDVQDPSVGQNAAYRLLDRKPRPAVDLDSVVGAGPRDPCGDQLGMPASRSQRRPSSFVPAANQARRRAPRISAAI